MRQRYDAKIKYGKLNPVEYENERFQSASGKIIDEVEKKTIFDLLKKHEVKNLLDVACGPGRLAFFLEQHLPAGTHITAVDINENMLARAKQHAKNKKSRILFKKADLYGLSLGLGKFDAVVGLRFSMHLPEFDIVLKNFSGILKKDGVLVFDIFNKTSLLAFNPAPGYYSFSEMVAMAKKNGFELCDSRGYLLLGVKFLEMCPGSLLFLLTPFITPPSFLKHFSTRLILCFKKGLSNIDYYNRSYKDIDIVDVPLKFSVGSKRLRQKLEEIVKKYNSIADLGCGSGGTLKLFRKLNPKAKLWGFDFSRVALKNARETLGIDRYVNLINLNLEKDYLPAQKFNLVYCSQVVEHFPEEKSFFKKISKSLIKDGYLFLATVYKKKWAVYFNKNIYGERTLSPDHLNEFTDINDLFKSLKEEGFITIDYSLNLFRFPIIDILLKFITKRIKNKYIFKMINSREMMAVRFYFRVPIIGFYNFQILARKA